MKFSNCKLDVWCLDRFMGRVGRIVHLDLSTASVTLCYSADTAHSFQCWHADPADLRKLSPLELLAFQVVDEPPRMVFEALERVSRTTEERHREVGRGVTRQEDQALRRDRQRDDPRRDSDKPPVLHQLDRRVLGVVEDDRREAQEEAEAHQSVDAAREGSSR